MFTLFKSLIQHDETMPDEIAPNPAASLPQLELLKKMNEYIRYYEHINEAYLEIDVFSLKTILNIKNYSSIFSKITHKSNIPTCAWSPDKKHFYCLDICITYHHGWSLADLKHTFYFPRPQFENVDKDEMSVNEKEAELLATQKKFKRCNTVDTLKMLDRFINKQEITLVPLKHYLIPPQFLLKMNNTSDCYVYGEGFNLENLNRVLLKDNGMWQSLALTNKFELYTDGSCNIFLDPQCGYKKIHFHGHIYPHLHSQDYINSIFSFLEKNDGSKLKLIVPGIKYHEASKIGLHIETANYLPPTPFDLEKFYRPYCWGALFGLFNEKLPKDVSQVMSDYLDQKAMGRVAQTCKKANIEAKEAMKNADDIYQRRP